MGLLSIGQGITSGIGSATSVIGGAQTAVGTAGKLSAALSNISQAENVGSAIRSLNLPAAGEAVGDIMGAVSSFMDGDNADDWRVRLSLANWSSFKTSPVLAPLKRAGGLVFPYTPSITIQQTASYQDIQTVHTNYTFRAFHKSDPGTITISAPMNVEDSTQGAYWIAALHYLRSLQKMFTGNDPKAGNPPPIIYLNGYGNYVFKNIPVVVTGFGTTLDDKCDYISCDVVGTASGMVEGIADSVGGLADTLGGALPGLADITSTVSSIAGGVGQVAGLLGTFGLGGSTSGGTAHVPTKSTFQITLQPVYSRDSVRKFSLDRFVTGGYLTNSFGYI